MPPASQVWAETRSGGQPGPGPHGKPPVLSWEMVAMLAAMLGAMLGAMVGPPILLLKNGGSGHTRAEFFSIFEIRSQRTPMILAS